MWTWRKIGKTDILRNETVLQKIGKKKVIKMYQGRESQQKRQV